MLVCMLPPDAPVDLVFATDANSVESRGFTWHISNAQKDREYRLHVRVGVIAPTDVNTLLEEYEAWASTQTHRAPRD